MAWLKLRLFLHSDHVEVGFFGISSKDDQLYIEDLAVPRQYVTSVSVAFDDAAVADHFDTCADAGIPPARCGRIWIHTHPGSSPMPSTVDEETFSRVFGTCDWAVMAIVARDGSTYARLCFNAGPGGAVIIPIEVDWERLPEDLLASEGKLDQLISGWMDEYGKAIHPLQSSISQGVHFDFNPEQRSSPSIYRDANDDLDNFYDSQVLSEDFSQSQCQSFDHLEVYP